MAVCVDRGFQPTEVSRARAASSVSPHTNSILPMSEQRAPKRARHDAGAPSADAGPDSAPKTEAEEEEAAVFARIAARAEARAEARVQLGVAVNETNPTATDRIKVLWSVAEAYARDLEVQVRGNAERI